MATFKISVQKHQQRKTDGKYPVSIRLYWQKKIAYIKTEFYVSINQINQKKGAFEVKDTYILSILLDRIANFEHIKTQININQYTASKLARYYEYCTVQRNTDIDFLVFGLNYCAQRCKSSKSYTRIRTSLRNLHDFTGGRLPISELTSKKLIEFENYLKTERTIIRQNQKFMPVKTHRKPCSIHCIADYMSDIRTVFNAALYEYNDEDTGDIKIKHYPFKKYKIPTVPETKKRNITPAQIRDIDKLATTTIRTSIARDVFLLSFLLVGMNTADLYNLKKENYKNGRLTYERQKTRGKRKDNAKISIKVEPEAEAIFHKYFTAKNSDNLFDFCHRYSTFQNFVKSVNLGLKTIAQTLKIDETLSTYYARHSWATIARNDCNISKSDIAESLNHSTNTITDIYIKKDWKTIDKSNRRVIDFVFREKSVKNNRSNLQKNV